MKSMKKLVLAALILLASVVVLAGCDTQLEPEPEQTTVNEHVQEKPNTEESGGSGQPSGTSGENDSVPEVSKYTVKFAKGNNTDDVSDLPSNLMVESGTVLTDEQLKPLTNTKNYVFVGWYDGETKAVAGTYTVTENVTLTAQWKKVILVTHKNLNEGLTMAISDPDSILVLEENITVSETIKIESGNVTIDLNGKTLKKESGTVVQVAKAATLTIMDTGTKGSISGNLGVENYGTVTVKDGIISGSGEGSIGVLNRDTGRVTVEGGEISGVHYGVENHGTVTVKDGIISGSGEGSIGVFNMETGILTVEGGEISGGRRGVENHGTVTVKDGIISGSGAGSLGMFNGKTGMLTVEGGEISEVDCGVENYGTLTVKAGIILGSGTGSIGVYNLATGMLTVEEGEISGGHCGVENYGTVTVKDGIISGSDELSIGVFNRETGILTVEGGEISGVLRGVENYRTVTVKDGIISDSGAGSIGMFNGETGMLTVEGGEISGGHCGVDNYGTVTVKDGIISGDAYGVHNSYSGTLEVTGGIISADGAYSSGVFNEGSLTVEGGSISADGENSLGVNNNGSLTVKDGIISGSGAGSIGVFNEGTLNLSGAPKITTSENGSDFYLTSPITIVGALTGDGIYYSVKWGGELTGGTKIVVGGKLSDGGEDYKLTADIAQKFTFTDIKVEFDESTNALVVKN